MAGSTRRGKLSVGEGVARREAPTARRVPGLQSGLACPRAPSQGRLAAGFGCSGLAGIAGAAPRDPSGEHHGCVRRTADAIDTVAAVTTLSAHPGPGCGAGDRSTSPAAARPGCRAVVRPAARRRCWRCVLLDSWHRHCRARVAAALVPASLLGGCVGQLGLHDPYYSGFSEVARTYVATTQQALTDGRSMQVLQAACSRADPGGDASDDADLDAAGGRKTLDALCAAWRGRSPAAEGAILNAYLRWVEDNVRPMQAATQTAASAAGGT